MDKQLPLIISLPSMSDSSVVAIHRCLSVLIDAFELRYGIQLWRYYEQQPQHERPARFDGEPF